MGSLGVSGGMAWTVRTDSLELWRDLVLHGMEEVDFHVWPTWTYDNQLVFGKMTPFFYFPGTWTTSQNRHLLTKWLLFLAFCWAPVASMPDSASPCAATPLAGDAIPWAWQWPKNWSYRGPKKCKNCRKTVKSIFHKNFCFHNFKLYLWGLGVSGGMAWTIRCDSLELWQDVVLHGMGEVDFHVFWKLTPPPNTSKFVLGPPGWSSDCFESQGPNKTD